jgi:hypothetical protein
VHTLRETIRQSITLLLLLAFGLDETWSPSSLLVSDRLIADQSGGLLKLNNRFVFYFPIGYFGFHELALQFVQFLLP